MKASGILFIILNSEECFNIRLGRIGLAQDVISAKDLQEFLDFQDTVTYRTLEIKKNLSRELATSEALLRYLAKKPNGESIEDEVKEVSKLKEESLNLNQKLFVITRKQN